MTSRTGVVVVAVGLWSGVGLLQMPARADETGDVRTRAERSFGQLQQHRDHKGSTSGSGDVRSSADANNDPYSSDQYWVGKGQGDLAKGKVVCQRVSELSARTDLAKQIRVMVKEHMVDRVRERSGRETDQDIELTREEIVQEYLQGVKIVDRRIDEENKACYATAVMLKAPMQPRQASDSDPVPPVQR